MALADYEKSQKAFSNNINSFIKMKHFPFYIQQIN